MLPWLVCVCETHPGWSSNHRPASISALTSFHMDKMSTWVQCFQKAISQQSKHYFHLLWLPGQRKHQDVHSQTGSHTVLLKTLDLDRLYWQWRINGLIIPIWQHFCENGSILRGCQKHCPVYHCPLFTIVGKCGSICLKHVMCSISTLNV